LNRKAAKIIPKSDEPLISKEVYSIVGFVRNCADGTVEICAQGSKIDLQAFVEILKNSPGRGSVDQIYIQKSVPGENYSSFSIQ
jgi:acylphosphatase